ncbi:Tm-1-like ATP-binding domain-containing protein, partial [Nocardiopsis composta]
MTAPEPPAVAVLGTFDTKAAECCFVADRLAAAGVRPVLVDCGVFGPAGDAPRAPDVAHTEVARAAGHDAAEL